MPQARSGGSRRSGGSSSSGRARRSTTRSSSAKTGRSSTKRTTASRASKGRSTTSRSRAARTSTSRARTAPRRTGAADARLEAAAQRLRKLNERIIEAGKEAGGTTLDAYEKWLKSIASSLERGPGKSDVEWISNIATAQAKFIRDVTTSVTKAARKRLK